MKALFIKPYSFYPYDKGDYTYNRFWVPLSLLNCASLLKENGIEAEVLDAHVERIKPDQVSSYIKGFDKIFVTSSSLDRWQCPSLNLDLFLQTVKEIKNKTDQIYILGYHGTINPYKILDLTKAKAVIGFEPELKVLDICKGKKLNCIGGLTFRKGSELFSIPDDNSLINLKKMPVPAYELIDFKKYYYELMGRSFSLFETSRGCSHGCRFCNKVMYGDKFRQKDISQIINELTIAIEKYKVKTGYFIDLDFLIDKKVVIKICNFLISKKYKFKWACQTRCGSLNSDLTKLMEKAGCKLIHLGIETHNQSYLNYINKNITISQIEQTINICKDSGIKIVGFFLFGLPGETESDRIKTLKFAMKIDPDYVSFHKIIDYRNNNFFLSNKINHKVDSFIRKALLKYYLRAGFLLKTDLLSLLRGLELFYGRLKSL